MPSLSVRLLATQDSNRAKTLSKELLEKQADVLEFSKALGQLSFEKETEEVDDLRYWLDVLACVDAILEEWAPLIVLVTDSVEERVAKVEKKRYKFSEAEGESAVDVPSEIFIVANLLRFLKMLLKTGKDKRCFLSYVIVGKLLRAVDSSIADLASWVLFNATTPTFSVDTFNTMELELKEVVEVPSCVSEDALILFEGLGMLSDDYSILDYVRGHEPSEMVSAERDLIIQIPFDGKENGVKEQVGASYVDVSIDSTKLKYLDLATGAVDDEVCEAKRHLLQDVSHDVALLEEMESCIKISDNVGRQMKDTAQLAAISFARAARGLVREGKEGQQERVHLMCMRLRCLYVVIHSRNWAPRLGAYLGPGGALLKQLVTISDVSSEDMSSTALLEPFTLSTAALECVLALLETTVRRKGQLSLAGRTGVLASLGLSRGRGGDDAQEQDSMSAPWVGILLSACRGSNRLLGLKDKVGVVCREKDEGSSNEEYTPDATGTAVGLYVRIGMELFITSLATNDASHPQGDIAVVGAIVGVVQSFMPYLQTILAGIVEDANASKGVSIDVSKPSLSSTTRTVAVKPLSVLDSQVLWTMAKALVCINSCLEHTSHFASVRECEGFQAVTNVVDIFSAEMLRGDAVYLEHFSRTIIESVFEILGVAIDNSRRNGFIGERDNEVQVLHRPAFEELVGFVFRSPFHNNEFLWAELLSLIKEAINAEPTYLAHFLRSAYAQAISDTLSNYSEWFYSSPSKVDFVLPHIARFTGSLCITAEGLAWVREKKLPEMIIDAILHEACYMPVSEGLSGDTVRRCARVLMHMIRDNYDLGQELLLHLRQAIKQVCMEAHAVATSRRSGNDKDEDASTEHLPPSLSGGDNVNDIGSHRMEVLQKLANICSLAEATNSDTGRSSSDCLRNILSEDVIEALVMAYPCILPSESQLISQLSIRQASHLQASLHDPRSGGPKGALGGYGYLPAAKAYTSLMKTASTLAPQLIVPCVLRCVDERLAEVSSAKSALRAFSVAFDAESSCDASVRRSSDSTKDGSMATSPLETSSVGSSLGAKEALESGSMPADRMSERSARQRRRSRGGSLGGDGANVLIVGVLDNVPHRCYFDPQAKNECNDDMLHCLWLLLSSIVTLEWYGIILSYCLRPSSRGTSSGAGVIGDKSSNARDVLRRLFAFHRSSMLEVCRGASVSWHERTLDESMSSNMTLMDIFNNLDGTSTKSEIPLVRVPTRYFLRVISQNGALIREDCEMEGSRVVFLAPMGSTVVAYQRSQTASGVVRYRTEHGWLSEYRRDHQKDNIVEVMHCSYEDVSSTLKEKGINLEFHSTPVVRKLSEALTMREVLSYSMTRVHASLRLVGIHLSRATVIDSQQERVRGITYRQPSQQVTVAPNASALATSLCKIIKGFLEHPLECLREDARPTSLGLMEEGVLFLGRHNVVNSGQSKPSQQQGLGEEGALAYLKGISDQGSAAATPGKGTTFTSSKARIPQSASRESISSDTSPLGKEGAQDENPKESVPVDRATMCLYVAAIVKHFVLPVLEDRHGSMNTYVLRAIMGTRGLLSLLDTFTIVFATLTDSIRAAAVKGDVVKLDAPGNCAIFALMTFGTLFRKLTARDAMTQSRVSAAIKGMVDEYGTFDVEAMSLDVLGEIGERLRPIIANDCLALLPNSLHQEWLLLAGELVLTIDTSTSALIEARANTQYTIMDSGTSERIQASRGSGGSPSGALGQPNQPQSPPHSDLPSAATLLNFEQLVEGTVDNSPDSIVSRAAQQLTGALEAGADRAIGVMQSDTSRAGADSPPDILREGTSTGVQRLEADLMAEARARGTRDVESPGQPGLPPLPPPTPTVSSSSTRSEEEGMHGHDRTALESGTMAGEDTLNWQSNSETSVDTSYVGPAVRGDVNLLSPPPPAPNARTPTAQGPGQNQSQNRDQSNNNRGSRRSHSGPRRRGSRGDSIGKDKDVSDPKLSSEKTDPVIVRSTALLRTATDISRHLLRTIMLLCERKGCIGVSGALDEGTRVLMPEVCKLISSLASQPHGTLHAEELLKQLDEPIAKEGVTFSFSHVLEEILALLSRALMDLKGKDSSSSVSLQSTLGLLLCLLRFPTAKADLVTAKRKGAEMKENGDTLREVGSTILEILMVALANHCDVSAPERVSPIPEWFSLALLFLRELLDSTTALLSDSSDCDEQVHGTASIERFISLAHSSGTFVRDKRQVKLMYDVCMGILRGPTVNSHESGQERAEVLWKEEGNEGPCRVQGLLLLPPAVCQATLLLLASLLERETLADQFVEEDPSGLDTLLSLPGCCISPSSHHVLSLVVQRCMDTPAELEQRNIRDINTMWGKHSENVQKKKDSYGRVRGRGGMRLEEFLRSSLSMIHRSPSSFARAFQMCASVTNFDPSTDEEQVSGGDEPNIDDKGAYVHLYTPETQDSLRRDREKSVDRNHDSRAGKTLMALCSRVVHVFEEEKSDTTAADAEVESNGDRRFTRKLTRGIGSSVLMGCILSDVALSTSRLPILVSQGFLPQTLPDFVLRRVFSEKFDSEAGEADCNNVVPAGCRLMVVLASLKGIQRELVLHNLVRNISENSMRTPETATDGGNGDNNDNEGDEGRVRLLKHLSRLMSIIIRFPRPPVDSASSRDSPHRTQQYQISASTILYLVGVDIQSTLTDALISLPFGVREAGEAIDSLLEPLELITRPTLQTQLASMRNQRKLKADTSVEFDHQEPPPPSEGEEQARRAFEVSAATESNSPRSDSNISSHSPTRGIVADVVTVDAETRNRSDSFDEDGDDSDEISGDEHDLDHSSNDDGHNDIDDDDGDDDGATDDLLGAEARGGAGVDEALQSNMSFFELETAERGWGAFAGSFDDDVPVDVHIPTDGLHAVSNIFETPPDRVRHDPLNFVLSRLDEGPPDSPEAMIVNLLRNSLSERYERERMRGPGSGTPSQQGGGRTGLTSGRAAARRDAMSMLPGGLELALSVHQPSSLHEDLVTLSTFSFSRATPVNSTATPSTAARASGIDSLRGQGVLLDDGVERARAEATPGGHVHGRFSQIGSPLTASRGNNAEENMATGGLVESIDHPGVFSRAPGGNRWEPPWGAALIPPQGSQMNRRGPVAGDRGDVNQISPESAARAHNESALVSALARVWLEPVEFDDERLQHSICFLCSQRLLSEEEENGDNYPTDPKLTAECPRSFSTRAALEAHRQICTHNPESEGGKASLEAIRKAFEEEQLAQAAAAHEELLRKEEEELKEKERLERERREKEEREHKERAETERIRIENEERFAQETEVTGATIAGNASSGGDITSGGPVCPPGMDPDVWASLPDFLKAEVAAGEQEDDVEGRLSAAEVNDQNTPAQRSIIDSEEAVTSQNDNQASTSGLVCPPGYDQEVFDSLPDFMQQEIVDEHDRTVAVGDGDDGDEQVRALVEIAGYDMATFQSLPDSIRDELLEQARREHPEIANAGVAATIDNAESNASFLSSLAPELRAEVLLTADADFLATLPPEIVAEAQMHRDRAASDWQRIERAGGIRRSAEGPTASEDDDSELEGPMSDDETNNVIAGRGAQDLIQSARTDGFMWLPSDDLTEHSAPLDLLPLLIKVVATASSKIQVSFGLVRSVMQHVMRHPQQRDYMMRLLRGVLAGDYAVLKAVESCIAGGGGDEDPQLSVAQLLSAMASTSIKPSSPHIPRLHAPHSIGSSPSEPTKSEDAGTVSTQILVSRIVHLMADLVSANDSICYDAIRPRNCQGEVATKVLTKQNETEGPRSDPLKAAGAAKRDKDVETKEGRHDGNIAVIVEVFDPSLPRSDAHTADPGTPEGAVENDKQEQRLESVQNPMLFKIRRKMKMKRVIKYYAERRNMPASAIRFALVQNSAPKRTDDNEEEEQIESTLKYVDPTETARVLGLRGEAKFEVTIDLEALKESEKRHAVIMKERNDASLHVVPGQSTNSLLEAFISLLGVASEENEQSLLSLVRLIRSVTAPYENLAASSSTDAERDNNRALNPGRPMVVSPSTLEREGPSGDSIQQIETLTPQDITGSIAKKELKRGYKLVEVPPLGLSRKSLATLCNVLRAESCSRGVFDCVEIAISRIAKMDCNQDILHTLLTEVVDDLAGMAAAKLLEFSTSFSAAEKPIVSQTSGRGETRMAAAQLPLIQAGSRHFERMHRSLTTLHSMSRKTNRRLMATMVGSDELALLWGSLEQVCGSLRRYLSEKDIEERDNSENNMLGGFQNREQAALTSILTRLLPLIEAFLLVHTCDLDISPLKSLEERDPIIATTTASGEPVLPGARYRNSVAYASMHMPLFSELESGRDGGLTGSTIHDGSKDKDIPSPPALLGRVPSLTRVPSVRRQGSSVLHLAPGVAVTPAVSRAHRLLAFVQAHSGVLNLLISSNPSLLEGSFSPLIRIPQLRAHLNFENKRKYFMHMLKERGNRRQRRMPGPHLQLRRDNVFEDSFNQLRPRTTEEMRGKMQVNFHGEEGVDAGGLTREWYLVLGREIFNPNYALFTADASGTTFQPNSHSMVNINHLDYFKFVGRVVGKAISDEHLMDAHFTRSFYKHILGLPVEYSDIEAVEPDYYKSLKQILDISLEDLGLDLDFTAETITFGKHEVMDLIPNGRSVDVTDENKSEYVRLIAHHRMTSSIRAQLDAFLDGFYELVPPALITIFSPAELELLICGLPDIDLDDLYSNTEYHSYQAAEPVIQWFWETLRGFNKENQNKFVAFVTGSNKVPLEGFKSLQGMRGTQKFNIHRVFGSPDMLPSAHTCFNQLDLPVYRSKEELKSKLTLAVNEASEGFGFA